MKRVYWMRHGIAVELGENGIHHDEDRPLSNEGRFKTRAVAQGLQSLQAIPTVIGTSPLVRTMQTAEIVHRTLNVHPPIQSCPFMVPGSDSAAAFDWIRRQSGDAVMLIGHMPDMTWLTHACLPAAERSPMHFKKASVASVLFPDAVAPGAGRLEWFHPPKMLRALGEARRQNE